MIESKKESPEEIEAKLNEFIALFPLDDPELIKTYLQKYAHYWKKSIVEAIEAYSDREKFLLDFAKWKKKQENADKNSD